MKSFAILLALALGLISPAAHARTHAHPATKSNGVGIMFGEPTGITAKFWRDEDQAIDAGLAFSLSDFVLLQSDYLWHFHGLFGEGTRFLDRLEPYLGAGAVLFISTESHRADQKFFTDNGSTVGFGVRVPFGTEWLLTDLPVGIFAELVPGLGFIPSTFGFFQADIGARIYF